jgi:phosphatidylserine/phosphatidylglycerophosphate/cardiolipin synthase-like enzyme
LLNADPKAEVNWALTKNDPKVTEWIYPTAYHIKVAVRDGESFWLSSGNFNVSNQPNLAANDPKRGSLANADRDWHVIVTDQGLAQLYEAYIQNDFQVAATAQGAGDAQLHQEIHEAITKHQAEQEKSSHTVVASKPSKPSTLGMHKVFTNVPVTVQPLLTPDPGVRTTLYVEKVLALVQSAQRSVYMQTQYVHPSDQPGDNDFAALVEALSEAHRKGLDVRLITSQYENTPQWIEKLKEYDLDQVLRIQERVHNKGIVVDSKVVMVSSQNWSADGTLRNRDAGLIIYNADIAQYFEAIFLDDWTNRADEKIVDASHGVKASGSGKANQAKNTKSIPKHGAAKRSGR